MGPVAAKPPSADCPHCGTPTRNGRCLSPACRTIESVRQADAQAAEAEAWRSLVQAAHRWASQHMDQWEQVKFETAAGTVYLTLSHHSDWPEAFDAVDADG